jgi:predicted Zn-dependent protease
MRRRVLLLFAAALSLAPAAAQRVRYIDPQDVAQARREDPQVIQELGGAEAGARAAYVDAVGRRVAAESGLASPGQQLHFTTLNSAVENAFSVAGGYVYVTRQLMALMSDESELAFALGHEVGHVAGNHAHQREAVERELAREVLPYVWMGQMMGGSAGYYAQRNLLAAKLQTLSFSRDQEYEADTLGLRYMIGAGYDPAGAVDLLAALSRETALEQRVQGQSNRQTPEWAMTHPLSENRMQRALEQARATGRLGIGLRNRDEFLSQLEGMYVDDDPAQGIIDGPDFTHPDLRIQFRVPAGYLMSNGTYAVTIGGSAGKAQFSGGTARGTLDDYILRVFQQLIEGQGRVAIPRPTPTTINGMPAAYSTAHVETDSGVVDASVVAYRSDPTHIYHFVMLTQGGTGFGPFTPMIYSLHRITPAEAAEIHPRIIHVVTVGPADTIQSLASRMAYRDFKVDRFLALNNLPPNGRVVPGRKVKIVVYGTRRS